MAFDDEFEMFYKKQHPALLHYAIYLIQSKEDALEIVNDVFVAVWKKRDDLQLNDSLKNYLFSAVKNGCINFYKKSSITFSPLTDIEAASTYLADEPLALKEQTRTINDVLDLLPPKCKQIFMMSRVDGFKYHEIAEYLDLSVKTVEAQMSKALKIFKNNIKRE